MSDPTPNAIRPETADAMPWIEKVRTALRVADGHIVKHHECRIMREELHECPLCADFKVFNQIHDALKSIPPSPPPSAGSAEERMSEQDLYYLGSILRQLQGVARSMRPALHGVADEALSDNIDWLDCFIDKHKRAALAGK